jgi:hypothetical protein
MDVVLLNPGLAELPDNYTGPLSVQFGVGTGHNVKQMPYSFERLVWGVAEGKHCVSLYRNKSVVAQVDADLEANKDGSRYEFFYGTRAMQRQYKDCGWEHGSSLAAFCSYGTSDSDSDTIGRQLTQTAPRSCLHWCPRNTDLIHVLKSRFTYATLPVA